MALVGTIWDAVVYLEMCFEVLKVDSVKIHTGITDIRIIILGETIRAFLYYKFECSISNFCNGGFDANQTKKTEISFGSA